MTQSPLIPHVLSIRIAASVVMLVVMTPMISVLASDSSDRAPQQNRARDEDSVKAEQRRIAAHARLVKRNGATLELLLANGKVFWFSDVFEKDAKDVGMVSIFRFDSYIPAADVFIVHQSLYEGFQYIVVDRKTGKASSLDNFPHFSSDYKRFATISVCDAYCEQGVQVWGITPSGYVKGADFLLSDIAPAHYWGEGELTWKDPASIGVSINAYTYIDGKHKKKRSSSVIHLVSGKWQVTLNK